MIRLRQLAEPQSWLAVQVDCSSPMLVSLVYMSLSLEGWLVEA